MTQEVKMLVGIPGSGKSTFAKQEVEYLEMEEHKTTCVISRDNVRFSMLKPGEDYFAHETEVFNEFIRQINEAMEIGIDVVFIDATHISPTSRRQVLSKLRPDPSTDLTIEVISCPLQTALERNDRRTGLEQVPDKAIFNMEKHFVYPSEEEFSRAKNYGFNSVKIRCHSAPY